MFGRLRDAFWAAYEAAIISWIEASPPNTTELEARMAELGRARAEEEIRAFEVGQ